MECHTPEEHTEIKKIMNRLKELGVIAEREPGDPRGFGEFIGQAKEVETFEGTIIRTEDVRIKPSVAGLDLERVKEVVKWVIPLPEYAEYKYEAIVHDGVTGLSINPMNPDDLLKLASFAEDRGWDRAVETAQERLAEL